MKILRQLLIVSLFSFILMPTLLFAEDQFYDAAGFNLHHEMFSMVPYENIDTFTGGVILSFVDARLPGNGELDLVIQRTFNSKSVCKVWTIFGSSISCNTMGENSWVGLGWTLHFGRVINPYSTNPIIEMPIGSRHKTYMSIVDSTKKISKDYWIYDPNANPRTVTFTDGTKIYYGHAGPMIGSAPAIPTLYATKIVDANGNEINITYKNPYGNDDIIYYVDDSTGRRINFYTSTVNNAQKLTSISGPGVSFTYAHESIPSNQFSRLTSASPAVGNPWSYSYGSLNELTNVTSPAGGTISYTDYDIQQFIIGGQTHNIWTLTQRQASGRAIPSGTWDFSYQSGQSSDTTTVSDACGRTITYQHYGYGYNNAYGSVWKIGLVLSRSISGEETVNYTWDKSAAISVESESSPYNSDYNIWVPRLTSQSITRDGPTYTTNYSGYDSYGNPGTISESGNSSRTASISYWYNISKNIVQNKPSSETVSGSFPGSFTISHSYNSNGNVTQTNKYGVTTNYGYHGNGNLQSETDANNKTTSYGWSNGVINSISTPHYTINRNINSNGTIASETDGRGNWTSYSYDGNLRLTQVSPPGVNVTSFSYPSDNSYKTESRGGFSTTYYYDGFGRPTGSSNSKGVTTSIAYKACGPKNYSDSNIGDQVNYDNFNRATQVVHRDSRTINFSYSGSNVIMTNESGQPTTYTYNAFGSPDDKYLVSVHDVGGLTSSYGRNMLGSLTSITQGGITRSFNRDTRNFLMSESHPETGSISYGRDNVGNMTARTDDSGSRSYTYDGVNRLTGITSGSNAIGFGYDGASNRTSMTSPSASSGYSYDGANRFTQKTETISSTEYITGYTYDGNDNITRIDYPTGLQVNYTYNGDNEVTSVTWPTGNITSFAYNLAGQPTSYTFSNGKVTTINYNNRYFPTRITSTGVIDLGFSYDDRGNTTALTNYINSAKSQSFGYDALDRLTGFDGQWGIGSFSYDSIGNRLSKTVSGSSTTYTYTSNRLSSTSGAEAAILGYLGNGSINQIQEDGITYDLTYDGFNNMIDFSSDSSSMAQFEYDGGGTRVKKITASETTVYNYDQAGRVISETDETGALIADYVYVNWKLTAKVVPDTTDSDDDGILDDGDGSGTAGDNPCTGGNTVNCDDNCQIDSNSDQADAESDGIGDVCDNCPTVQNPKTDWMDINGISHLDEQVDYDLDGVGNKCDLCIDDPLPNCNRFHSSDTNQDWTIGDFELLNAIDDWANGLLGDFELLDIIDYWAFGTFCWDSETGIYKAAEPEVMGYCSDLGMMSMVQSSYSFQSSQASQASQVITAVRNLPTYYIPGSSVDISLDIDVNETDRPKGLLVKENIPAGWEIISATPTPSNCIPGDIGNACSGEIKWMLFDMDIDLVINTSITYSIAVLAGETGTKTFTGELNYIYPAYSGIKTIDLIGGDTQISLCPIASPVKVGSAYYSSLQTAYNSAGDGDIIKAHAVNFTENLNINRSIPITLEGGYDCEYSSSFGETTIEGDVTIDDGSANIGNLIIKENVSAPLLPPNEPLSPAPVLPSPITLPPSSHATSTPPLIE